MPFDIPMQDMIPENLDFEVMFEPTKVKDKKYVINAYTGEYIGVVGDTFNCASHTEFFEGVHDTVTENLGAAQCEDMNMKWRSARQNAWAMLDMTLPNVTARIETDKHSTTIAQRIIALHGVDGSCSNQTFFGAIDFFCTNGMIRGEHDKVRRKNTANFTMDRFIRDLRESTQSFYAQSERLQGWANKPLYRGDVKAMLDTLLKSDRMAEKMFGLYNQEASVRGQNVWALYSAFTNYASYADERNGFSLRNTGKDTGAVSMFQRENKVSQWIESKPFKELIAA
mgnify:FL=1|tara:strand:- start:116 stop:964 length:849 start_codon:yes stop_codon:yes gene_type:complete